MTLLVTLLMIPLAIGLGVAVGRRRGTGVGIATGFVVLAAGCIGYIGLLAMTLPM